MYANTQKLSMFMSCWLVLAIPTSSAQVSKSSGDLNETSGGDAIDRFTYANSVAVVKIRTSMIAMPPSVESNDSRPLSEQARKLSERVQSLKRMVGNEDAYFFWDLPFSKAWPAMRGAVRDGDGTSLSELKKALNALNPIQQAGYLHFSRTHALEKARGLSIPSDQKQRADYRRAMETIANFPIQCAIVPPEYLWRTLRELSPEIPAQLGGGRSSVLTEGLRWAALGFDPASLKLSVKVQSTSPADAQEFAKHLPKLLSSILGQLSAKWQGEANAKFKELAENVKPQVVVDRVEFDFAGAKDADQRLAMLSTIADQLVMPISLQTKMDRLKQIGLALHNYESSYKSLPPAKQSRNAEGSSNLSWRVHILPFLGQNELFQQFRLNEPWDSPHNKSLLGKMPEVFQSSTWNILGPIDTPADYTAFVAPVGEDTIFGQREAVKLGNITDGTSNTLWLVEVKPERAVPWTAPLDYQFDSAAPAAGLNISSDGKFIGGAADGSVRSLPGDIDPQKLLYLFQKSDGHVVTW